MSRPHDSDPRPGQRFAPEETAPPATPPRPGERFATDLPTQQLEAASPLTEQGPGGIEAGLAPPRRRRWGLLALLGGSLGLGGMEAGQTLFQAGLGGDWLAGGWSLLLLLGLGLGGSALLREGFRLRRLKRHAVLRERLALLPEADPGEALAMAEELKKRLGLDDDHPHWQGFLEARQPHHDGRDIRLLLSHHLLAPRDREARRMISRMSGETAVMVAVSPLTLVDMALVAWRNLAMVDRLCRLYGLELGYASRLRLLRSVLHNMAFVGATEMAGDAGMDMLSMDLAGRLSTRAGQGLGIGLLSARLGLRTQRMTRPLAFAEGESPRMSALRGELWQQLRRLDRSAEERKGQGSPTP